MEDAAGEQRHRHDTHYQCKVLCEQSRADRAYWAASRTRFAATRRIAHSITSSASVRSADGTARPSARAVFMLMTSSNLVGCGTGNSAGFAPLRMRPTYVPAWRYVLVMLAP